MAGDMFRPPRTKSCSACRRRAGPKDDMEESGWETVAGDHVPPAVH